MRNYAPALFIILALTTPASLSRAAGDVAEGVEMIRQGRYEEAIEPLRQARTLSPLDPGLKKALAAAYLGAGAERLGKGNPGEALPLLREGHDLDPEDGRLSLLIGVALLRLGESGEAEAYLLDALRQSGPSAEVYRYLAEVCYAGGRLHEAQSFLEQAVELRPEDGNYRALLDKLQSELRIEEGMGNRHGGNFSISYVDGGERLGGETLEVLQEACARLGALFDVYPAQPVSVILYGARDFSEVTGAPDWAGGAYDGKIRVPVRGLGGMNDNLRRVLCHEYAHVLIHALTRGNLPRWLDEGLAQVTEGEGGAAHLALLERARGGVGAIPFSRLERSFHGLSTAEAAGAYLQSRDFVSFLLDRYGWPRMLDLLQALGRDDRSFAEAAGRLLLDPGEDFRAIQEEWLEENGRGAA